MNNNLINRLVRNKRLLVTLPIILAFTLALSSQAVLPAHALTGIVCITFPSTATSCPATSPTYGPVTKGTNITVGVRVQASDAMGGFDILVHSDPAVLNPRTAALGGLIVTPSLTSICVNGSAAPPGGTGSCTVSAPNGPGTVEVTTIEASGANECGGIGPCSGLAFTITYTVVSAVASTTLTYPSAAGCATTSVAGTTLCVLVDDAFGTTLSESIQTPAATITQAVATVDPTTTALLCTSPVGVGTASSCTATVTDTATTGATNPTGTVTFSTSGSGTFTPNPCPSLTASGTNAGTCMVSYTPNAVGTGTHSLTAKYNPDATHMTSSATAPVTVNKATPTITTGVTSPITVGSSTTVSATLTGGFPSTGITGSVTYNRFAGTTCTGTATLIATVTVGAANAVPSTSDAPTPAGSYAYQANYGGDGNNTIAAGTCALLTVNKVTPTVTTAVSPASITIGASATDLATVSGFSATGTVTYTAYSDAACTVLVFTSSNIALGTPSGAFTPSPAGTYLWKAAYSGDANNNAVTTACGAAGETLTVAKATPTVTTAVSPASIAIGASATDLATVSGFSATGTVTYTAYSDAACTVLVFTSSNIALGTPSGAFTPGTVGTFLFKAAYSGDANNNAVTTACGAAGETLTVIKATPTVTTAVSPASITIGASASDLATVSGGFSPTGTVTYTAYSDAACTTLVFTSATVPIGTGSGAFTPSAVGTYLFKAAYSGDANNNAVTTACGATGETLTVIKATPTVTTAVSPASITIGQSASDLATVSGGFSPSGTVVYTAYSDAACTTLVFTSATVPVGTGSGAFTPSAVGTYLFKAAYSGDANNNAVTTTCGATGETLAVIKATPAVTTAVSPASITIGASASDLATVSGGFTPTGTVTYTAYSDAACATLVFTSATVPIGTGSGAFTPSAVGTFLFKAAYSGDANNNAVTTACGAAGETLTVIKATPTVTTAVSPASITIGSSASDLATVTGGFSPSGTVVYTAYSDAVCATLVFTSATVPVGTASGAFTPSAVGTFLFKAAYSGDANNNAVTTTCGATGETLTVIKATPTVTTAVSPASITIGQSASDLATVSGGFTPTGTVTYTAYSDAACTTLVFTSATVPVGTGSGAFTPAAVGTFLFKAAYGGDASNNAVTTACGATGETLTVIKATPTVTTAVSPASITIGASATDLATVSGGHSPTGTVTYTAYSDAACTTLVFTSSNIALGTPSGAFTPGTVGTFLFKAAYSGDANNNAVTTTCGATGETLTVIKATPTVTSAVSPASITIGASATDLATVSGGFTPTGTVTYTAYSDAACATLVFTSANVPLGTASAAFTASTAGTYLFKAAYNGDANNNAVSTVCGAAGETLTVAKATPTVTTAVSPASITIGSSASDLATVTGGFTPTGTVVYTAYSDAACATLVFTSATVPVGTGSGAFTPAAVGTFLFKAAYSGDVNNNAVTTVCGAAGETLTVAKATPTVTTAVSPASITIGASATDLATVSGGHSPTGTVTYTAYSNSACTTLVFTSANIPLGTASGAFTPSAVGTYFFIAAYSGDASNNAVTTTCGATGETLTVIKATPIVTTAVSPASITIGQSASDLATVSGGFTPTGTVVYTAYSDAACTTLVFTSAAVPVGTGSGAFTPAAVGTFLFKAAYSGDANNNAVTTTCGAAGETLTVIRATPTVTTAVSPVSITLGQSASDLATVSGGFTPTGTVVYTAYSDAACTTLVFTSAAVPVGTGSGAFTPAAVGTFLFKAAYGGDANNNAVTTACGATGETLTVTNKATPTVTTTVTPASIPIGGSASDLATVSGGSSPTGTVTYTAYSDAACTTLVFTSANIPLGSPSASFTPSTAGTYLFKATYNGDANNNVVTTTCGAAGETLTVNKATPTVTTAVSPASITIGASATDLATVSGFSATGTVTYTAYSDAACTVLVFTSSNIALGTPSGAFTPGAVGTGTYLFKAMYNGDTNNNAVTTTCGAAGETLTVAKATPTVTTAVSPASIAIGASATDLATVSGFSATGTVTYTAYSDAACTVLVFTSANIPLGTASGAFTPGAVGTYLFKAAYSGDVNNNAVTTACGATGETLTVIKATPTVTTAVSPASITIGASASDLATVSGGFSPTGTVTYTAYSDAACTTLVFTSAAVPVGTGSGAFTPAAVGTFLFKAAYSGDANNNAVTTVCGAAGETLTVSNKATPTVTTTVTPASITIGGSASDLATVSGGSSPTGTVTYTAYSDAACTTLVFTSANVPLGTASAAFTPSTAGTYLFKATYNGDANNNVVTTTCGATGETLTVAKTTPTVTTAVSPASITLGQSASDLATVSGGFTPTGTVTYTAYSDAACTTLVFTSANVPLGTASAAFTPTARGTYLFKATYNGDANNNAVTTACGATGETLTVIVPPVTVTTVVSPASITIGGSATDLATVSGGSSPTGTVTYTAYSDSACTVLVFTSANIPLGSPSAAFTPTTTGTYLFKAAYSGDANNNAATTACGATGETLTVNKTNITSLTTGATSPITIGGSTTLSATLVGGFPSTGVTGTVTYFRFTGTACIGTSTTIATVTVGPANAVPSASDTPASAGSFAYQATYNGDTNNNSFPGTCATVTVNKTNITSLTTSATSPITVGGSTTVSAMLVGGFPSTGVTGSVTYTRFVGITCTGTGTTVTTVTVGAANTVPSASDAPPAAGSFSYQASYTGDTNNNAFPAGTCATVTVMKTNITSLMTAVNPSSITLGQSTTVSATLAGGFPSTGVTGTVTYTRFATIGCTGTGTTVATVTIGAGNTVPSATDSPTAASNYTASYNGDANNNPFTGTCAKLSIVTQFDFSLTAAASSLAIPAGGSGSDVLTVASLGTFTGSVALTNSAVPSGVTVMFVPNPVVISTVGTSIPSVMTIFAGAPAGTTFLVTVTGTSGTISHSVNITVTITPSVAFTAGKLHWTHHLSLSKSGFAQSWTAIVANSLSTSANVVIRITGQSTTVPGNHFDVTCGVVCVDTNGNVNNAALAAGPVSVPVTSSFSFSFSQTNSTTPGWSTFLDQKISFTATVYWSTSSVYGATSTKSGSFAVVP